MTKITNNYDIIFTGWGASTCILMIEMEKKSLLKDKKILIIEPSKKLENDKTFCFWAEKEDQVYQTFEKIISKKWSSIQINNNKSAPIYPVQYFHVNSKDLYNWAREIIDKYHIQHLEEYVVGIESAEKIQVVSEASQYSTDWVFDSRPPDLKKLVDSKFNISQSFFGFKVELLESELDPEVYRMMDFRVSQREATQFVYILPYSKQTALIELTRFGKNLLDEVAAEKELHIFINKHFGTYKIFDKEKGVIPMNSELPKQASDEKWVHIGTKAGNVKPSTGYAFKNMFIHSQEICKNGALNSAKVKIKSRFHFYDQLLLIILTIWPSKGQSIFERLFKVKSASFVLKFLDEKTSFFEELTMFSKLHVGIFIKSVFYWAFWNLKKLFFPILIIVYSLFDFSNPNPDFLTLSSINLVILIFGLLTLGIPHGALDHLTESLVKKQKISLKFVIIYLLMMLPIFIIWYWSPSLALLLFILYSAWHFGQTELNYWGIKNYFLGFLWGILLFAYLFLSHLKEFSEILNMLSIDMIEFPPLISFYFQRGVLFSAVLLAVFYKKLEWILIILFFFLARSQSLILTFGLYFIFQHSRIGWLDLKKRLNYSNIKMFKNALPFNIGAIVLFIIFSIALKLDLKSSIVYSFVFLSAISFPHVICMHLFYSKKEKI